MNFLYTRPGEDSRNACPTGLPGKAALLDNLTHYFAELEKVGQARSVGFRK